MKVTVDESKWTERGQKVKDWSQKKMDRVRTWAYANKETLTKAIPVAVVAIHGVTKVISGAQKNHNQKMKEEAKTMNVYDPMNGQYCRLKRPMTNSEKVRLDDLRSHGYSITRALDIMGLLN